MPGQTLAEYAGREDDIPGIFGLMEPMPGAVESFLELAERFDVYVLSTAPWENPTAWSDKLSGSSATSASGATRRTSG